LLFRYGFEAVAGIPWQMACLPIYLFGVALGSGWWTFIALPLLLVLAWRTMLYLRDESDPPELLWIYLLGYFITLRASGDRWLMATATAVGISAYACWRQQRAPKSTW
jgi:hypothetical protein